MGKVKAGVVGVVTDHLSGQEAERLRQRMRLALAPIGAELVRQMRADSASEAAIRACAARKGLTCDAWEARNELKNAKGHFELGCWLSHYSGRVGAEDVSARIDCLRRLLISDLPRLNPGYGFSVVFGFGERQFDTIFEMGDADDVLRAVVGLRGLPQVASKFEEAGWTEGYLAARGLLGDVTQRAHQSALFEA